VRALVGDMQGVNENGVVEKPQLEPIQVLESTKSQKAKARITLAATADGLFTYGLDIDYSAGGMGSPISMYGPFYDSRQDAVDAALDRIVEYSDGMSGSAKAQAEAKRLREAVQALRGGEQATEAEAGPDVVKGSAKRASTLRALGDKLKAEIEAKRNPGAAEQRSTRKRRQQIDQSHRDAAALERLQAALYGLADAHDAGQVPAILAEVKSKAEVADIVAGVKARARAEVHKTQLTDLLDAADLCEHEEVQVVNVNNGARFSTYVIPGPRGSGVIQLNGAAARLGMAGDLVIVISYGVFDEAEAERHVPTVVFVDDRNRIVRPPLRAEG